MSYTDLWVCTDCYFAHHYGVTPCVHGTDHLSPQPIGWDEIESYRADGWTIKWNVGESDDYTDLEPLGLIPDDSDVTDNTCSNHRWRPDVDDDGLGWPCPYCGQTGDENGEIEFSWQSCQGCGSTLGGARYRLALHDKETV